MYNDKVMDHFLNPRNVGKIENPDAYAKITSASCGDLIEVYMTIDKGIIKDVKFQTFGCAAAIAASSMLTVLAMGKTLEEAREDAYENIKYVTFKDAYCRTDIGTHK